MDTQKPIDNPNSIEVIDDSAPIDKSNDAPVIPTIEELTPPPPPPPSVEEVEAPYGRKADGTPRAKPGRKATGEPKPLPDLDSVTPARPRPQQPVTPPSPKAIAVNYQALGQQAANLWFNLPQIFLGEEWAPEKEEVPVVASAFKDYFEANGISNFPPGVSLALVLGSYTLAKAAKPTIRERISGLMGKVKGKIPWIK